jgi:hypothetical protein
MDIQRRWTWAQTQTGQRFPAFFAVPMSIYRKINIYVCGDRKCAIVKTDLGVRAFKKAKYKNLFADL